MRAAFLLVALLIIHQSAASQFSGYGSTSFGYQSNPLHNYLEASDQIREGYLDLGYENDYDASTLNLRYVGGLVLFNRLSDKTYYEHTFQTAYAIRFDAPEQESLLSSSPADSTALTDSSGSYLYLGASIGARHDKTVFDDYDNHGVNFTTWFRFAPFEAAYVRIGNTVDLRSYTFLEIFSNVTDQVMVEAGSGTGEPVALGARLGFGVKHYTSTAFDTSTFQTRRTFVTRPSGKGKGGGNNHVPSTKRILINPQANDISQLNISLFGTAHWSSGSVLATLVFRKSTGGSTRYLAQYATSTVLSQDIYNDYFNYEGPGLGLKGSQALPGGLQAVLTVELRRDQYAAPALNLDGVETGPNRLDQRRSAEMGVSRYTELGAGIGIDVGVEIGILRSQSNDEYNDYSAYTIALQIGIGF